MWGTAGLEVAMPSSAEKSEEDGKNTVLSSVAVAQNLMFSIFQPDISLLFRVILKFWKLFKFPSDIKVPGLNKQ